MDPIIVRINKKLINFILGKTFELKMAISVAEKRKIEKIVDISSLTIDTKDTDKKSVRLSTLFLSYFLVTNWSDRNPIKKIIGKMYKKYFIENFSTSAEGK